MRSVGTFREVRSRTTQKLVMSSPEISYVDLLLVN